MKLTDEQIDQAAKAMFESGAHSRRWFHLGVLDQEGYRQMALAAAPFLQVPWEPPTPSEISDVYAVSVEIRPRYDFVLRRLSDAITAFVDKRNAKPVDPRRAKIIAALSHKSLTTTEDVADRILSALDAKD